MATYYVRKNANSAGTSGAVEPPDVSGLFYWFDGSDAAAVDSSAVWTGETNTDDMDISTVASTTTPGASNDIYIEGTNAPASGDTISSVDLWIYLGPNYDSGSNLRVIIDEDGGTLLENFTNWGAGGVAGAWNKAQDSPITAPGGGWTWAKIQALEASIYLATGSTTLEFAAVGVMVHTTAQGTKTTDPFRHIDEAANAVAAGDTVYIGAGVYREQVTMDTSGTSGNIISYIGDIDGSQTGDPGLVVISAYDDEASAAARTSCLNMAGKEFITWQGVMFDGGGTACVDDASESGNRAYEETTFENCNFNSGHIDSDNAVNLELNEGATPTTAGLTFRGCYFGGTVQIRSDENATAEVNCKMTFENNIFAPMASGGSWEGAGITWDIGLTSTYWVGGVTFSNNFFDRCYYAFFLDAVTTTVATHKFTVRNNVFYRCNQVYAVDAEGGAGIDSDWNSIYQVNTVDGDVAWGDNDAVEDRSPPFLGGIHDLQLYRTFGWSPYRPYEPFSLVDGVEDYNNSMIGSGDTTAAPATDFYGEDRPMGQVGTREEIFYFDSSDAGPTDNNTVWTGDTNIDDGSTATEATTTTTGSTNWIRSEGTTAPASGGDILQVERRWYCGSSGGGATGNLAIHTDGQGESLIAGSSSPAASTWTTWATLSEPSGGWTWAKVQALEATMYYLSSGTTLSVGVIEIRVTSTGRQTSDDRGAVEARTRPTQETTTIRTGTNSFRLDGAGFHDFLIPVKAQSTTVSIYGRYDSNHTGSLPQMQVLNIPGVADQTDTMTGLANTWEELTATFTPTADGVARVRVISRDTSVDGKVFFDDLTVT